MRVAPCICIFAAVVSSVASGQCRYAKEIGGVSHRSNIFELPWVNTCKRTSTPTIFTADATELATLVLPVPVISLWVSGRFAPPPFVVIRVLQAIALIRGSSVYSRLKGRRCMLGSAGQQFACVPLVGGLAGGTHLGCLCFTFGFFDLLPLR